MKLYLVALHEQITESATIDSHTWCSSQSDAAAARKKYLADGATRKDMSTYEVEVPTGKVDLIRFLNDYQGDAKHLVATRNLTAS